MRSEGTKSYLLIIHFLSFRQNYYLILIFAEVSRKLQNQLKNVNLLYIVYTNYYAMYLPFGISANVTATCVAQLAKCQGPQAKKNASLATTKEPKSFKSRISVLAWILFMSSGIFVDGT